MRGAEHGTRGLLAAWGPALLAIIVATGCISPGLSAPREPAQSSEACYRDDFGGRRYNNAFEGISTDGLRSVVTTCVERAGDRARPTGETIYANFYVGKARRLIASNEQRSASDPIWRDAEKALRLVVDFTGPRATVRSSQSELRFELTRIEAEVELAQALANQNKKQDAVLLAQQAISEYVAFPINPTFPAIREQANGGAVNASYVLATIYRTVPPSNDVDALRALHPFIDARVDSHPRAADARADIVKTATMLGLARLEKGGEDLATAQSYFAEALDAAGAAYRVSQTAELRQNISDAFINLGRVNMKIAGRLGPDAVGGCEPAQDLGKISEATGQFANALANAASQQAQSVALQWKGCAELAANNPSAAVTSFQLAANADARSSSTQLSLARALYREATRQSGADPAVSWRDARRSYENALALMESNPATRGDNAFKSKVRVEVADFDMAYLESPGITAAEKPRVIGHAVANLKAAAALAPTQADAYLRLGLIQLGEPPYAGELNLEGSEGAAANLAKALKFARDNTALKGEAHYLLSRLEVRRFETRGAADRRAAIANADRATELGDEQRGPIYFAQACEARLVFGIADGAGTQFCVANESRDGANYPLALLHEGMYFLSKAKTSRTSLEQSGDWEAALLAFGKGERNMAERGQTAEWSQLRARLVTGRGLALGCSGLRTLGQDAIVSVPVTYAVDAREFFDRYGVKVCAAPRRN